MIIIRLRTNRCEIARTRLFASLTFRSARLLARSLVRSPYSRSRALRDYLCCIRASSPIRADEFIVREVVGPGNAAARLSSLTHHRGGSTLFSRRYFMLFAPVVTMRTVGRGSACVPPPHDISSYISVASCKLIPVHARTPIGHLFKP